MKIYVSQLFEVLEPQISQITQIMGKTEEDKIIIKSIKKKPRKGWKEAFDSMRKRKEDTPFIDDSIDSEMKDWEW